jgi:hypothetical protein
MSAPTPVHNFITHRTVSGAPIVGDCIAGALSVKQTVAIGSTPDLRSRPATYVDPNPGVSVAKSLTSYPQTIAPGSVVTLEAGAAS